MSDDKKNKLGYLSPELLSEAAKAIDFEATFYRTIANKKHFRIIPIPTSDSGYLNDDEKQDIIIDAIEADAGIVYQILLDNGDYVVYGTNPVTLKISDKFGYIPATEYDYHS